MKETKYIVHYLTYHDCKDHTKMYRIFASALSDLEAFRNGYERLTRDHGMKYCDGTECTECELAADIESLFFIEEVVTETRRLDY